MSLDRRPPVRGGIIADAPCIYTRADTIKTWISVVLGIAAAAAMHLILEAIAS